jgi:hypothetical protein
METRATAELELQDDHPPGHRADVEIDLFIQRREHQRVEKVEDEFGELKVPDYNLEEHWRRLEEEQRDDRKKTLCVLWARYHKQQAQALRATMQTLVNHHEREARRYGGVA